MTVRAGILLLTLVLPLPLSSAERDQLPTVLKKVEPEYGPQISGFFVDPTDVEITIDQTGVPFALKSSSGLPDNVVQALAQWRYRPYRKNGHDVAFSTKLIVPIRRPITPAIEQNSRPVWRPEDQQVRDAVKLGKELDAEGAAKLAQDLPQAEAMSHPRTSLLIYYARLLPDPATARQERAKLIAWLIENYPDDEILGSPAAIINASGEPLADPDAQAQEKQVWLNAVKNSAGNVKITEHAVNFLRTADPSKAAQLVTALTAWPDSHRWLGNIYALAALEVNARDPGNGKAIGVDETGRSAAFAKSAQAALLASNDPRAVLSAMMTVFKARASLSKAQLWRPEHQAFCERLLEHTKQIYSATSATCSDVPAKEDEGVQVPVKVDQRIQQAKLKKKAEPHYPQEARSRRIQGTVAFSVIIDPTGHVQQIELLSGPLALYSTTRQAIMQWEWFPTLVNGRPVEVSARIETNFALQ